MKLVVHRQARKQEVTQLIAAVLETTQASCLVFALKASVKELTKKIRL